MDAGGHSLGAGVRIITGVKPGSLKPVVGDLDSKRVSW